MKRSIRIGFSFGLTSGIVGTLGLMVGLNSSTSSKLVVVGGILAIAIAEGFSEAVSIHVAEEFENKHSEKEVWESTFSTLLSKFTFSAMFIIPVLLFDLELAVILSILFGLYLLFIISLVIARERNVTPWKLIIKHLSIAAFVIIATHYIGLWLSITFG
jgi:VIT1/CCC1 family predicted Fe2+/Mn2+ transporter